VLQEANAMGKIVVRKDGNVASVLFSNPEKMNAMTYDMWIAVPAILAELDADPSVRIILATGEGSKSFISGADLSQFKTLRQTSEDSIRYSTAVEAAFLAPSKCSKPVIASISGYCYGGGLGFAAGCDLRIASENAKFCMPAARLGVAYPPSSIKRFIEVIGAPNTMDIFLTARKFDANEAARIGLVNHIYADADLECAAVKYAKSIAENAPLSVTATKYSLLQALSDENKRNTETAMQMVRSCFFSADHQEGRDAFLQKRTPRFTGT
jgi:enoyl-CoA hydratase/carnithine racemase